MNVYQIEVRDTLVLRDNRPMVTGAGRATTMELPWPSTLAGVVRTRVGSDAHGRFVATDLDALKRIGVQGPWLVETATAQPFFPAPRDGVWFHHDGATRVHRLTPRVTAALRSDDDLLAVGLDDAPSGKASSGPRYWSWRAIERWLFGDGRAPDPTSTDVLHGLPEEERTHVALGEDRTYEDGQLFTTMQRRFVVEEVGIAREFAIGFGVSEGQRLEGGLAAVGGERRVAWIAPTRVALPTLPAFEARLASAKRWKVTLLTPAIFDGGALPASRTLAGLPIVAAVVPRPEVLSGWDFAARRGDKWGAPKPTRRAVPAGSVYWLDATGADVRRVAEMLWFQCVSSQPQDRLDGFGLAVVSVA